MSRMTGTPVRALRAATTCAAPRASSLRPFSSSSGMLAQDSAPGWGGRHGEDHSTNRNRLDVQGDASQEGMKKFQEGKDQQTKSASGQAISRSDERDDNKRAKKDNPEAPEPVIGMNSERGGKGH